MPWPLFSVVNTAVSKMSFLCCQPESHSLIPSVAPLYYWIKHTSLRWYRMFSMIGLSFPLEPCCSPLLNPHSAPITSFIPKSHRLVPTCASGLTVDITYPENLSWHPKSGSSSLVFPQHPGAAIAHSSLHPERVDIWNWALLEVCDIGWREGVQRVIVWVIN